MKLLRLKLVEDEPAGEMKIPRRRFLRLAAGAGALPMMSRGAAGQTYPARPVRIIVGFAPASSPDIVARVMAQRLSERLRQQFIVDNRPGASTNIATEAVVRAAADGYTLLWATSVNAINATLYDKLNFDFAAEIAPVVTVARFPNVMVTNPSVPARTIPEFIAYAKANPGKINIGTALIGGTDHLSGELFQMMTGIRMVLVPYRGGGASLFTDLLSGQIQVNFPVTAASIGYIRAGKLRPLAVTTAARWEGLPEVPSMGEFVTGYEAGSWHGVGVPKGTPVEIIDKLNKAANDALADPRIKAQIADLGGTVLGGSPADFGKFVADETEKWSKVIRSANIKAE
jgi:tripartite-type tricarboxylate transporter receptor subunit TctC